MTSQQKNEEEGGIATCFYTEEPVSTPNDVHVSISPEAVIEKISNGKTRLGNP